MATTPNAPHNPYNLRGERSFILSTSSAYRLGFEQNQRPRWMPNPSRAVVKAEKAFGWGSKPHQIAVIRSQLAMEAYIRGESWPVIEERPSLQEKMLVRREFEVGTGGAKGGGKSFGGILWLVSGNYLEPDYDENGRPIGHNISYTQHPEYAALVLRQTEKDLDDWIRQATPIMESLGGKWIDRPKGLFRFYDDKGKPIGSQIYTGHLQDANSWKKYFGKGLIRILLEEATQVASFETYLFIRSCCRSAFPELRAQIMNSTNPLGDGMGWYFDRFVEPKNPDKEADPDDPEHLIPCLDENGIQIHAFDANFDPIYPEPVVHESAVNPFTGETETISRVFLPARLDENPHLLHNSQYVMNLATMLPAERESLLLGRWNPNQGAFFREFRPLGPQGLGPSREPDTANHVVYLPNHPSSLKRPDLASRYPAPILKPWWYRVIGMDWGYDHETAIYFGAKSPEDGALHVYREMMFHETTPEEVGVEIAMAAAAELKGLETPAINLWIGMDIQQDRIGGGRSVVELLAKGIGRILGNNMVHVPDMLIRRVHDEAAANRALVDPRIIEEIENRRGKGITIRYAPNQRVQGWQVVRYFLRWWPAYTSALADFDPEEAFQLFKSLGEHAFQQYLRERARAAKEILPKVLIWCCCQRLIAALPRAKRSELKIENVDAAHFLGMDCIDAFRYLLTGYREEDVPVPRQEKVSMQMGLLERFRPNMTAMERYMAIKDIEAELDKHEESWGLVPLRGARAYRMIAQGKKLGRNS